MSRWLPETLELHLGEDLAGNDAASVLADFERQLAELAPHRGTRLRCVIGGATVRHLVVPWSDELSSPAQRQGLVQQTYWETYGDVARDWTICHDSRRYGAATLACAVENRLLDGLDSGARARGRKLVSVQPALMHSFNHMRPAIDEGPFWYVLVEQLAVTLLLMSDIEPMLVKRVPTPTAGLQTLLDREWFALGQEGPRCPVFVARTAQAPHAVSAAGGAGLGNTAALWSITELPRLTGAARPETLAAAA